MNTLKLIAAGVACVIVGYCALGPGLSKETAAPAANLAPVAAPPAPAAPPPPPKAEATAAIATFMNGDVLDECVDVALTMPPGSEPAAAAEKVGKLVETMRSTVEKGKETAPLKKTCSEQFSERTALGTCRAEKKTTTKEGVDVTIRFVSQTYNADSLDTYMKDCLKGEGDWKSADQDTINIERMHQRSKSTRKLLKAIAEEGSP